MSTSNPSNYLNEERKGSTLNLDELSLMIFDSKDIIDLWKNTQRKWNSDPILKFKPEELSYSRENLILEMIRQLARMREIFDLHGPEFRYLSVLSDNPPVGVVHRAMFIKAIEMLGNEEQTKKWLPPSYSHTIIGCYAQTEFGHGSDIQSLQTTATYDEKTRTFTLNMPNVKASQYWPGELGLFANHALVQAQLIVKGKQLGIHHFIVQIRDINTHEMMPNVKCGDIGPQLGYSTKDNGFLILSNVNIPKDNMLQRYTILSDDGEYQRIGNQKYAYATMTFVRCGLLHDSNIQLARALTIGVRYSAFRRQFKDQDGNQRKVLDYQAHLDQIVPLFATLYAQQAGFNFIIKLFFQTVEKAQNNDFSTLQDLHAISSGMKSIYSGNTHIGIDKIRLSSGGQGYNDYSGLPPLWRSHSIIPTVQGENTMIIFQLSRFLLKNFNNAFKGKKVSQFTSYFLQTSEIMDQKINIEQSEELKSSDLIEKILIYRVVYIVSQVAQVMITEVGKGSNPKEVWDMQCGIQLIEAATVFVYQITFSKFKSALENIKNQGNRQTLDLLLRLYGIQSILDRPLSLIENGFLNGTCLQLFREERDKIVMQLRPELIPLTDAFLFEDQTLKSAIARSDGQMYETLLEWTQTKNPLNTKEFQRSVFAELQIMRDVKPKL